MAAEAKKRVHVSEDAILGYVEGRAANREAIEAHLDVCDECRLLVAELARTSLLDGNAGNADVPWGFGEAVEGTPTEPRGNMLPHPGALLANRFRIVRALGHGAMGMVYEAMDEALGVGVAIKVFWPSLSRDERVVESIRREASLGRRIHHPNVRRVFDVERSDGYTFLTMELIQGESLEDRLQRAPVSQDEAIAILAQVCDALSAAHAAGIVHRDLKPGNIALDGNGRVIVMDFGLARDVNAEASRAQGRGLVGTPAYWSPEQARGEAATPASDIYSLGLIAYRLLTGQSFSLGGDSALGAPFRAIVDRCLELKPNKRYASAAAAKGALLRARRSHLWIVAGGIGAFVVVALVATIAVLRGNVREDARIAAPPVATDHVTADVVQMPAAAAPAAAVSAPGAVSAPFIESVPIEALPIARTGRPVSPAAPRRPSPATGVGGTESRRATEAERAAKNAAADTQEERVPRRPQRPIDREDPYSR